MTSEGQNTSRAGASRRKPRIDSTIRDAVKALAPFASPIQIRAGLPELFPGEHIPDLKTIRRYCEEARVRDESAPWRLETATPGEAATVPECVVELAIRTNGIIREVTSKQAAWIARIKSIGPHLDNWRVWAFCEEYLLAGQGQQEAPFLDALLASEIALSDGRITFEQWQARLPEIAAIWPNARLGLWWHGPAILIVEAELMEGGRQFVREYGKAPTSAELVSKVYGKGKADAQGE